MEDYLKVRYPRKRSGRIFLRASKKAFLYDSSSSISNIILEWAATGFHALKSRSNTWRNHELGAIIDFKNTATEHSWIAFDTKKIAGCVWVLALERWKPQPAIFFVSKAIQKWSLAVFLKLIIVPLRIHLRSIVFIEMFFR